MPTDSHLGLLVYRFDLAAQNRLIVDCLGPAARSLRADGLSGFWFSRFDAGGPHVWSLWITQEENRPLVRRLLADTVANHLAADPSDQRLPVATLQARHEACRGKVLCPPHGRFDLADPDTVVWFEQPADGYPFKVSRRTTRSTELAAGVDALTSWAIHVLGDRETMATMVRWLSSTARILASGDARTPRRYWRYHLSTLLPTLAAMPEVEASTFLARLRSQPGPTQSLQAALQAAWRDAETLPSPWHQQRTLIAAALADEDHRWPILREINHTFLKQLGLPMHVQIQALLVAESHADD